MLLIQSLLQFIGNLNFFTAYVSGSNSFPQPLDEKEEKYYLEKLSEGDQLSKNILVERNLRLVAHIVKKYSSIGKDMDDLISIGTVGLIKAIDSFDTSKGTRLATYAARCIENEILMLIRNTKKTKGEVYLQDPIGIDKEGNEISLMDVLSSEEDSVIEIVQNKIQVKKLYEKIESSLSERERIIIKDRYGLKDGKPKTQREIAKKLGISRSYVSRIEKRALNKLNKSLNIK
ncbi:RNA polymerase sporulation sigma factor SigK [Hathewaya massiliensis]|uniref:RNA polymerase sporulation sigma factor SigK n=1 Tax=Hathewaya massiliensis TaxID=1964382 RepID=UPI003C12BE08